uniref:Uncharacterized protein n=1 Tax=Romanomermis culicivorax TaxID=13658 RepID=A0A915ILT2_ROMCU
MSSAKLYLNQQVKTTDLIREYNWRKLPALPEFLTLETDDGKNFSGEDGPFHQGKKVASDFEDWRKKFYNPHSMYFTITWLPNGTSSRLLSSGNLILNKKVSELCAFMSTTSIVVYEEGSKDKCCAPEGPNSNDGGHAEIGDGHAETFGRQLHPQQSDGKGSSGLGGRRKISDLSSRIKSSTIWKYSFCIILEACDILVCKSKDAKRSKSGHEIQKAVAAQKLGDAENTVN